MYILVSKANNIIVEYRIPVSSEIHIPNMNPRPIQLLDCTNYIYNSLVATSQLFDMEETINDLIEKPDKYQSNFIEVSKDLKKILNL